MTAPADAYAVKCGAMSVSTIIQQSTACATAANACGRFYGYQPRHEDVAVADGGDDVWYASALALIEYSGHPYSCASPALLGYVHWYERCTRRSPLDNPAPRHSAKRLQCHAGPCTEASVRRHQHEHFNECVQLVPDMQALNVGGPGGLKRWHVNTVLPSGP